MVRSLALCPDDAIVSRRLSSNEQYDRGYDESTAVFPVDQ